MTSTNSALKLVEDPQIDLELKHLNKTRTEESLGLSFALVVLGVFGIRLFLTASFPLIGDEAYYWLWSKHLALGYHDHSPLVGWLIRLSTLLSSSDKVFWIRFPALLCGIGSAIFFYLFSRDILGSRRKAELALLVFLLMPILTIASMSVFPDAPLIFSWVFCLWAGWKSLQDSRYWPWVGLALGLALLSKLIGFFLLGSFGILWLFSSEMRAAVYKRSFWIGVGIFLAVSSPLWIWNASHHWENFVFQAQDHLSVRPEHPFFSFIGYLGAQALGVSPILFLFFLITGVVLAKRSMEGNRSSLFLLAFSFPILILFLVLPFWAKVGFHWAVPGYISLMVACVAFNEQSQGFKRGIVLSGMMTALFCLIFGFPRLVSEALVPVNQAFPKIGIASFLSGKGFGEVLGYAKLSDKVKARLEQVEPQNKYFILTDSYTLSSDLAYYANETAHTFLLTGQGGEYARWDSFASLKGKNALWVDFAPIHEQPEIQSVLNHAFRKIGTTDKVEIQDGAVTRSFYMTPLYGLEEPALLSRH